MKKSKNTFFAFIILSTFFAFPAPAAESPQDIMGGAVVGDIAKYLEEQMDVHEKGEYSLAVGAIADETGALATEAILMKRLLFGRFSQDSRFRCAGQSETERVADAALGGKRAETVSQDSLKELGEGLDVNYFIAGRLFKTEEQNFLQIYLFDLRDGVLLYTPVFSASQPKAEKPAPVAPPEKKAPEFAPEGGMRFFEGDTPGGAVLDFAVYRDDSGALAAAFLTTASFEVFRIMPDNALKRVWQGEYKKTFPERGTAASLNVLSSSAGLAAVVSMNPFKYSFKYAWEGGKFEKAGNVDDFVVDMLDGVELVSRYGKGVVSFAGASAFLRLLSGANAPEKRALTIPVDFLDGCILNWAPDAPDLMRVAVVDETGTVRVYGASGAETAKTVEKFGGGLDCGSWDGNRYLAATTASAEQDSILLLRADDGVREVWRSQPVGGAVYRQKFADLNGDGKSEIAGTFKDKSGKWRLFAVSPVYGPSAAGE